MRNDLGRIFCSSHCRTSAVRLAIRGEKLFFLRKSLPLRERNLVGVSPDGRGKQTVLRPGTDGGYDLSALDHADQVITLCRNIPCTDNFSPYIRVPITFTAQGACFHNTPAIIYNTDKLARLATDKESMQHCLEPTDYFQSDKDPIKNLAAELAGQPGDDYFKVIVVHDHVARHLFYDHDELKAAVRQDDSSLEVLRRRHTTCRGYVSLCVSLLRAMGIPAQEIPCYLASPGQTIDPKSVTPKTNHVVVGAFADGRWLILDPTLDSHNVYKNGEYHLSGEEPSYAHFDMSEQFLSFTHWLG